MTKKLTQKQINQIRLLHETGYTQTDIVRSLNVSRSTVKYWCNEKSRQKTIERSKRNLKKRLANGTAWRQKNHERIKEYTRNYIRTRYQNDEDFRKKFIQSVIKYNKKAKKEGKLWSQQHPEEYKQKVKIAIKRLHNNRKAQGLCPRCGKERDDRYIYCSKCRIQKQSLKNKRKSRGLCPNCGNKPENNHIYCLKCRIKRQAYSKKWRRKQNDKSD